MAGPHVSGWGHWFVLAVISAGTLAALVVLGTEVPATGVASLLRPGGTGPSIEVIRADFPGADVVPDDTGHDGQQFYAIARAPMHPDEVSDHLDRPRYRYQRILMPLIAWVVQPTGGGPGLVVALFGLAVVGTMLTGFCGALVAAGLGASERACSRVAFWFPLLPGAFSSAVLTVSDSLALGLALGAIAADQRGRPKTALVLGVAAVLTKEPVVLVLAGWAMWRGRRSLPLVVVPAAVAAAWWALLRLVVEADGRQVVEFAPVAGFVEAVRLWLQYPDHWFGAVIVIGAVVLGVVALRRRGVRSPLGYALALQLALFFSLAWVTMVLEWNGARTTGPLVVLAVLALCCPLPAATAQRVTRPLEARA